MKTRINVFPWNFVFDLINSHARPYEHLYKHIHTLLRKYAVDRRTRSLSECRTNS